MRICDQLGSGRVGIRHPMHELDRIWPVQVVIGHPVPKTDLLRRRLVANEHHVPTGHAGPNAQVR
jgi:hypothetical protein